MRALVLGAGKMGRAIASDLLRQRFRVTVADSSESAARALARELGCASSKSDVTDPAGIVDLMRPHDVAVSAVPYFHNLNLAHMALEARTHFVDLGGNEFIVRRTLDLDREARRRGVCLVPDCGLAPGLASFLVARGMLEVRRPRRVRIRVGGLPQHPRPPLNYQIVFSLHGLVNEYSGWCTTLRHGRLARARAMSGVERVDFEGLGTLEAFHTSGGASTLPYSLEGRVRDLDYKTLRYPGHCERMRTLMRRMSRAELLGWLERHVPQAGPDLVAVAVDVDDWSVRLLDRATGGFSAMMRTTGFPAAIVAGLAARGRAKRAGALLQERDFDPREFLGELAGRGVRIRQAP